MPGFLKRKLKMKKTVTLVLTMLLGLSAMAQDAPKNNFKLYGFIRNYFIYDSRESVSGTGDLFYYLPKDVNMKDGIDLNDHASFGYLSLTSRLGVDVSGYYVGNAQFGAKIEGDFYSGLSNSSNANATKYFPGNTSISGTAQMRLRQAYATVTWKDIPLNGEQKAQVGLKMGQAWHPMAADFPHLFSLEVGAPFGPFSRTPQVTMDASLGKNWVLSASALWQMQYQSAGPSGASAAYIKYACTPEMYLGVTYKNNGFLGRLGADILSIKPRNIGSIKDPNDPLGIKTIDVHVKDRKTSVLYYAYLQYNKGLFSFRAKTTYGEGGEHLSLMSGYAKVGEDSDTGTWKYASLRNSSSWVSFSYGKKWQGVFFAGYMKNLGLAEKHDVENVYFNGNGSANINQMYRINPQGLYNFGKFSLGLEYQWTAVQYGGGAFDKRALKTEDLHWVGNHRVNMMVKFTF